MRQRGGIRLTALTLMPVLVLGGCVTTTAHRLVLADNPLREQAIACETRCRQVTGVVRVPCDQSFGGPNCTTLRGNTDDYGTCLDYCPGARAKDDSSCPEPPVPDVICVETSKANAGGIAGTVFLVIGIGLAILALAVIVTLGGAIAAIGG